MIETDGKLSRFINPEVISSADFLAEEFATAKPFRHIVIDDFFNAEYCRKLISDFPEFDEKLALNEDGIIGAKAVLENIREIGPEYRLLDELSKSEAFLQLVGKITSIADLHFDPHYYGGGTHENRNGQGLAPHVDFNFHPITREHRRLNLIVYLNEEWEDEWGGTLQLHKDPYLPPSSDEIKPVTPLANRCVIFETNEHSWHSFPRIDLPEDKQKLSRKSFALYYYTATRPEQETGLEHSTIYVEEHLPESWSSGMTLDADSMLRIQQLLASRDQHLKRLYDQIKQINGQLNDARYLLDLKSEQEQAQAPAITPSDLHILEEKHREELARSLDEFEQSKKKALEHRDRIKELEASTSWRITAPLRAVKSLFGR